MNDNHSHHEWNYLPRWLTSHLQSAIASHPIVILTGPRQVGKSTFLSHAAPTQEWHFLSMDDLDVLAQARRAPASLLLNREHLVLDEIQKVPELLSELKRQVDKSDRRVRYVLSGSANLLLMQKVSETLAGRAVYFTLDSMTIGEQNSTMPSRLLSDLWASRWPVGVLAGNRTSDLPPLLLRGMMPPVLFLPDARAVLQWWEGYVTTFLERDLRDFSRIDSLPDFRNLMTALALRSGKLLNQTEVSRDIGMLQPTVHRYFNLLETMHLVYRLSAFAINRTKRLVKSPKTYWFDVGLAAFLAGIHDEDSLKGSREFGSFFETLVFQHLRVWCSLQVPKARLFFWRTTSGKEVDFVIEHGRRLIAVEVKASEQARYQDIENLKLFLQEYGDQVAAGILAYSGSEIKRMDEKVLAVPWQLLV